MSKQPLENVMQHLYQIAARAEFKTLNDQELLKRYVRDRDELAFGELVRRYKAIIWHVCWHVLRQNQDVEDAFQATIMTLVRRAQTILGRETIEGWLHRTAYRVASNARVVRKRRLAREERRAQMQRESFENDECQRELGEVLNREFIHIPEKYRGPLILCYLDGLTQEQAAQRLGISIDALDWRLRQGREQLKKRLSKYGMEWGPTMLMTQTVPGGQIPEVPPGLVERTLDMVRIMTLSNGALKTAGISPQVATLVKGALGVWTLKVKLCLGLVLLSLAGAGAAVARHPAFFLNLMGWEQPPNKKQEPVNNKVDRPQADQMLPRKDLYCDPLPPGALARLGTVRFRGKWNGGEIVFTPDSKAVGVFSIGEAPHLWDMKTGEQVRQFGDSLRGQVQAGSWLSLDGRRMAYIHQSAVNAWRDGYHVHETATGKLIRAFALPHNQDAYCCSLSPDGKTLVGYFSGDIRLMDIGTGQPIWEQKIWEQKGKLEGIRGPQSMLFSPDGQIVAVGYEFDDQKKANKGGIELRDARTGKSLRTLGHPWNLEKGTSEFSFSPDGQTLMVAYKAEGERRTTSVYLWDVATGKERWHLDKEKHAYSHPSFSPDGKMIALREVSHSTLNWEIGLYEAATGKKWGSCQQQAFVFAGLGGKCGGCLTFSPDSKVLASMQGCLLRCWDVATGKVLASPPFGHESLVQSVAFAANGRTLISRGENYAVHVWDCFTGQKQRTLSEESSQRLVKTFYEPTNSQAAAVSSADGKIVASARFEIPPLDEKRFTIPEDLEEALRASMRANIYIWDAVSGRELRQIKLDCSKKMLLVRQLALSPDGKRLAAVLSTLGFDFVSLWEVATGEPIGQKIYGAHHSVFSPDSTTLLVTHQDGVCSLWETATGKKVSAVDTGVKFASWPRPMVTPDWQTLVGVTVEKSNNELNPRKHRWYLNSLQLDKQAKISLGRPRYFNISGEELPNWLAMSPDGKMMALSDGAHADGIIHLLETATGKERACFQGHNGRITSLSFSPDGRRLASSSNDTTILVWDVTGRLDDRGQLQPVRLSAKAREEAWELLKTSDAVQAHRVIWNWVAARSQTVSFLAKHLHPVVAERVTAADLARLIADLDNDTYAVRQRARQRLEALGEIAEPSLRQTLEKRSASVEVRRTLQSLLATVDAKRTFPPAGQELRELRAIEILEQIGTPEARRLLQTLSQGAPSARQTREAQTALRHLQQAGEQP